MIESLLIGAVAVMIVAGLVWVGRLKAQELREFCSTRNWHYDPMKTREPPAGLAVALDLFSLGDGVNARAKFRHRIIGEYLGHQFVLTQQVDRRGASGHGAVESMVVLVFTREPDGPACGRLVLVRSNPVTDALATVVNSFQTDHGLTELPVSKELKGWRVRGDKVAAECFPVSRGSAMAEMLHEFNPAPSFEFGLTEGTVAVGCAGNPGIALINEMLAQAYELNTLIRRLGS